jgi:hypothetical protein
MMKSKRKELRKVLKKSKFMFHDVNNNEFTIAIDGVWTTVKHELNGELVYKCRFDDLDEALDMYIKLYDKAELDFACEVEADVINAKYGWE